MGQHFERRSYAETLPLDIIDAAAWDQAWSKTKQLAIPAGSWNGPHAHAARSQRRRHGSLDRAALDQELA